MKPAAAASAQHGDPTAVAELVSRTLVGEDMASGIERIADAVQRLADSPLKWSTVVLLVSVASGIGKRDTECVLKAALSLRHEYLKPVKVQQR